MKRVSLGVARLEIGCGRISVWIQSYTADDSIRKVFEKRKLTTYSYHINGCVPGVHLDSRITVGVDTKSIPAAVTTKNHP